MLPIAESGIALQRIRRGAQFHRLVTILKMRESRYDEFIHEFDITEQGFEVQPNPTSAEELLQAQRGGRQ
jgi:circadian clock protein KaiC